MVYDVLVSDRWHVSRPMREQRVKKSTIALIAGSVTVASLSITGVAAAATKDVALNVDGSNTSLRVMGGTVSDVLAKQSITVGEHDLLMPAADSRVADGTSITVRYGRQLTATIDGQTKTFWTTANTLDAALAEIGLHDANLSVDRSLPLGRDGLTLTATTPKAVTVTADGQTTALESTLATVADLLSARGITVDADDRLSPAPDTALTEGLNVVVQHVTVTTTISTADIAFKTIKTKDVTLDKGTTKNKAEGKVGIRTQTFQVVTVDGTEESRQTIKDEVTAQPVDAEVLVGAKVTTNTSTANSAPAATTSTTSAGLDLSRAAMWDSIARCESTNNWSINTGNGYYGGLQFNLATWRSVGGTDFAPRPDLATREEQITVANRLYAQRGLQPWSCRWAA